MAIADVRFAKHTNMILDSLPHWFKMRKGSADSIGARFLNVSGLELDDALFVLDYAYEQCYINSIDIDQVDFCYKAIIPMPLVAEKADEVIAGNKLLVKADDLKQFFGVDQKGIRDVNVHSFELYYVDKKRNIIYVRDRFHVDALNDNGKIKVKWEDKTYEFALTPHPVWNFFDEIGNLLSCPRIYGEPNFEYKTRIEDVFKNKANASRDGLVNGIARELALRKYVTWNDPSKNLELKSPMIVLNSIKVGGEYFDLSKIKIAESGNVMLVGDPSYEGYPLEVTYAHGIEMHQLYLARNIEYREVKTLDDKEVRMQVETRPDAKLGNELFTVEGRVKNRLRKYIDILNRESPLFWDDFTWDEHYWDMNRSDVTGVGYIPHLYDGSIRGFAAYD